MLGKINIETKKRQIKNLEREKNYGKIKFVCCFIDLIVIKHEVFVFQD